MLQPIPQELGRKYQSARADRAYWDQIWRDVATYCLPYQTRAWDADPQHPSAPDTIYDETGIVGVQELVSRLVTGIVPEGIEWARLQLPSGMPDQAVQNALAEVQHAVFAALDAASATAELTASFSELAAYGTCCLELRPGTLAKPIVLRAVPIADVWLGRGRDGDWGDIHVRRRMLVSEALERWPAASSQLDGQRPDRIVEIIESWETDRLVRSGWTMTIHLRGYTLDRQEKLEHSPWIVARWSRAPGQVWGLGQGMLALPSIRTLNHVMRQILTHADMALAGMWQAEDDGILNPYSIRLEPGAVVPIAPGSRGLMPLQLPSNQLGIAQLVIEELRMLIRKSLYSETISTRTSDTPPTALEIQARMRELARLIGPAFSRVWKELCVPLVRQTILALVKLGQLDKIAGLAIDMVDVVPQSSMAVAARADNMRRAMELAGAVSQLYGPATLQTFLPPDRFVPLAAWWLDVPPEIVPAPEEIRAMAERAGQVAGQTAQMPGGMELMGSLAQMMRPS